MRDTTEINKLWSVDKDYNYIELDTVYNQLLSKGNQYTWFELQYCIKLTKSDSKAGLLLTKNTTFFLQIANWIKP